MLSGYSGMTMGMVQDALQPAADAVSAQMEDMMSTLANNPDPSPTDLAMFQANMQVYTTFIQMNSAVVEKLGSAMNQVATNIGN